MFTICKIISLGEPTHICYPRMVALNTIYSYYYNHKIKISCRCCKSEVKIENTQNTQQAQIHNICGKRKKLNFFKPITLHWNTECFVFYF